jgi:hypothetical protein
MCEADPVFWLDCLFIVSNGGLSVIQSIRSESGPISISRIPLDYYKKTRTQQIASSFFYCYTLENLNMQGEIASNEIIHTTQNLAKHSFEKILRLI